MLIMVPGQVNTSQMVAIKSIKGPENKKLENYLVAGFITAS